MKEEEIPSSNISMFKHTLSIDDQVYIKRCLDGQTDDIEKMIDKSYEKHRLLMIATVAELMDEKLKPLYKLLEEITGRVTILEDSVVEREVRMRLLERYVSFANTVTRMSITLFIGLGLGYFLHAILS